MSVSVFDLKNGFHIAMHAMGAVRNLTYTNSREAFEYWFGRGVRIFEVDIAKTDDGEFVCLAHGTDSMSLKRIEIYKSPERATKEWFMGQKLFRRGKRFLHPLSLESLVALLIQHEDVIFMMDLYKMTTVQLEAFAIKLKSFAQEKEDMLERILIEVYTLSDIKIIKEKLGQSNVIFGIDSSVPNNVENPDSLSGQLREAGISFVSFPERYHKKMRGLLSVLAGDGFVIFSLVKNQLKEKKVRAAGASVMICNSYIHGGGVYLLLLSQAYLFCHIAFSYLKRELGYYCTKHFGANAR